jgi:hypothetical protein
MLDRTKTDHVSIIKQEGESTSTSFQSYTATALTLIYFILMIIFNIQAGNYIDHQNIDAISMFLSLTIIQVGLGFLLAILSLKIK